MRLSTRAGFCGLIFLLSVAWGTSDPAEAQCIPGNGPFLGQSPPGTIPEPFCPGFFSSFSPVHGRLSFTPDGRQLFWAANAAPEQSRWTMTMDQESEWSAPRPSWLSLAFSENGLSFNSTGSRAFFHSRRSIGGEGSPRDQNIWFRERNGEAWSDPIALGASVNRPGTGEYQPTITTDGRLFFSREEEAEQPPTRGRRFDTQADIFEAQPTPGGLREARRLGPEVNSPYHETEPAVAPDGSFLAFTSNRPGGFSPVMNLYVSLKERNGEWGEARSLSDLFQLENIWFPSITPDGRYLFFCTATYTEEGIVGEYYWVDTRVISNITNETNETNETVR